MRCRSCCEEVSIDTGFSLDEISSNYAPKKLCDMILITTGINPKTIVMPEYQYMCVVCIEKMEIAYDFILQTQNANRTLLNIKCNKHTSENPTKNKPNRADFDLNSNSSEDIANGNQLHANSEQHQPPKWCVQVPKRERGRPKKVKIKKEENLENQLDTSTNLFGKKRQLEYPGTNNLKRSRGRPKKYFLNKKTILNGNEIKIIQKRKPGRPRKNGFNFNITQQSTHNIN